MRKEHPYGTDGMISTLSNMGEKRLFKHSDRTKAKVFFVIYLLFIAALLVYIILGSSSILDFMNGAGAAAGIVGGVVLLLPVLLVNRLTTNNIWLSSDGDHFVVEKRIHKTVIGFSEIEKMTLNKPKVNSLNIYGKNGKVLYLFTSVGDEKDIFWIMDTIAEKIEFDIRTEKFSVMGGTVKAYTYERKYY